MMALSLGSPEATLKGQGIWVVRLLSTLGVLLPRIESWGPVIPRSVM